MYYLNNLGLSCNLGSDPQAVAETLLTRDRAIPDPAELFTRRDRYWVGMIKGELPRLTPELAHFDCRNNQLAAAALAQLQPAVEALSRRYGSHRIAVVMGTSTSGIAATEAELQARAQRRPDASQYHAVQGMLGGLGDFVSAWLQTTGPVLTVSTACSSSGNALLSARRLLRLNICDAVVVGGVDSFCELTLQGFASLEALSAGYNAPFTVARDGINLGEAASVFLLSREPAPIALLGGGSCSDAHHISAPHPQGNGAAQAMQLALADADLDPKAIDYLNLHGTGTPQNDAMEAKAVHRLFGNATPCSSTKAFTGHTLGTAGALELALCWLLLKQRENWRLPPTLYAERRDPALASLTLTGHNDFLREPPHYCMSNSFAFGGSNVSLIIGTEHD